MTIEQQLLTLKGNSDKLNTLKIENSTKLKSLEEEKEKLLIEAAELGIAPDQIETILKQEEAEIKLKADELEKEQVRILEAIKQL